MVSQYQILPNFNPKKENFFVMLHLTCTCIKFFTTRGAWAPVSLHRPDISTMAEEVFNNYHSIAAF